MVLMGEVESRRTETNRADAKRNETLIHTQTNHMTNPRPSFKQSAETVCVLKLMTEAKPGDVVTYESMRNEIRYPIDDEKLRRAISSARRVMMREHAVVFDVIPTVGYQVLLPGEVVDASDRDVRGIKRKAQKATAKLATVDTSALNASDQTKLSIRMAVFGVVAGQFDTRKMAKLDNNSHSKVDVRGVIASGGR